MFVHRSPGSYHGCCPSTACFCSLRVLISSTSGAWVIMLLLSFKTPSCWGQVQVKILAANADDLTLIPGSHPHGGIGEVTLTGPLTSSHVTKSTPCTLSQHTINKCNLKTPPASLIAYWLFTRKLKFFFVHFLGNVVSCYWELKYIFLCLSWWLDATLRNMHLVEFA